MWVKKACEEVVFFNSELIQMFPIFKISLEWLTLTGFLKFTFVFVIKLHIN